jgi:hypothetical protein
MSVVMQNRKNNVLAFPKPPEEEPGTSTIIAQIGSERSCSQVDLKTQSG